MKTVYVNTIGCIEALCDENRFREYLQRNGWIIVDNIHSADFILFNTCGLRIDEVIQRICLYKKTKRPDAELIICGCFPFMNKQSFREIFEGRYFGPRQPEKLSEFLGIEGSFYDIDAHTFSPAVFISRQPHKAARALVRISESLTRLDRLLHTSFNGYLRRIGIFWYNSTMFYLKVATGCMGTCSYCAIRFAKGRVISVPLEKVMIQFKQGLSEGKKEFVLSAEDVGSYGQDIGIDVVELLRKIVAEPGDYTIHIRYIDPYFLISYFDRLRDVFASGRIISFCSAVQSGSNQILKLMNKEYRIEQFIDCIEYINNNFPWMFLRTHIIVGFPQETEDDFLSTYELFDKISFNQVSVFQYKAHPYNPAADMGGQISEETKRHRARRLKRKLGLRSLSQTN